MKVYTLEIYTDMKSKEYFATQHAAAAVMSSQSLELDINVVFGNEMVLSLEIKWCSVGV